MAWQLDNMATPTSAGAGGVGHCSRPGRVVGGRSLQLGDIEHLPAHSTLLEGTKLIISSSPGLDLFPRQKRVWILPPCILYTCNV